MMANLYKLTQQAANLYDMLQSGDIDEQVVTDTLEAMMAPEALEGCCQVIRQLEADVKAYKAEKDLFDSKKKLAEAAMQRMKAKIGDFLAASGQKKIQCGVFTVRMTSGDPVQIVDESKIPKEYYLPQPDKISTAKIKEALKAGVDVPGAMLGVTHGASIK